ncbi:hypothetical protein ACKWRH_20890 [Bradyrhizobium sp. Pa8]|uniref:hypothetical protein n=1 Tax=Bradyrhizobium sp. Pa8 TaxID=3386552 RepID=UPI00403F1F23
MTALSSYSTGTVAVSADGTVVTGTGTIWSSAGNVKPGDLFQSGHYVVPITDVTDDTHLVITPWPGATISGATYAVYKVSQQRIVGETYARSVDQLVGALNTSGFFVFVDINQTTPDPSLGNDGQYAMQPTTGKQWVKSGGTWVYQGIYKAFQVKGAWSGATAYASNDVVALNGSSYVCILDHTNHTPPNSTYWQVLASKGDTGAIGLTGAGYGGTSTTSLAVGTGSKAFTTQAGLAYQNGARVRASSAANTSNWMEGLATYSGTTLTMTADKTNGSGTLADWNLNVVGQPGAGDLTAANNLSDLASAATASTNLGVVRYGGAQSLTAAQQAQARANIGITKKNYIINGAMMVSQENGTTAGTTSGYYPVDQWSIQPTSMGSGTFSVAQIAASTPGGSPNRIRLTVTAAQATVGSSFCWLQQKIEGYRVADLLYGSASAKAVTVSLGVKTSVAGTYAVQFLNAASTDAVSGSFTISAGEVNTDVVKTVTIAGPTGNTWAKDNTVGILMQVMLMAAGQANIFATNGNNFDLFDVGIYEGGAAPSFVVPSFAEELQLCKRYWEKSYNYSTPPTAATAAGAECSFFGSASGSFNLGGVSPRFKKAKRAAPTVTIYSDLTGATNKIYDRVNGVDVTPTTVDLIGENGFRTYCSVTAGTQVAISCHWTANARL